MAMEIPKSPKVPFGGSTESIVQAEVFGAPEYWAPEVAVRASGG